MWMSLALWSKAYCSRKSTAEMMLRSVPSISCPLFRRTNCSRLPRSTEVATSLSAACTDALKPKNSLRIFRMSLREASTRRNSSRFRLLSSSITSSLKGSATARVTTPSSLPTGTIMCRKAKGREMCAVTTSRSSFIGLIFMYGMPTAAASTSVMASSVRSLPPEPGISRFSDAMISAGDGFSGPCCSLREYPACCAPASRWACASPFCMSSSNCSWLMSSRCMRISATFFMVTAFFFCMAPPSNGTKPASIREKHSDVKDVQV